MFQQDSEHFHPRNIGSSKPLGSDVYEIGVFGHFHAKASSNTIELILSCNGNLIKHLFDGDDYNKTFAGFYYVDASVLACSISQLVEKIRKLPEVKEVQVQYREGHLFGHFMFPFTSFNRDRLIAIRMNAFLSVEGHFYEKWGSAAATIMYDQGRSYGAAVVKRYREILPNADQKLLVDNIKEGSKATGWGIFDFRLSEDGNVHFSLRHPPMSSDWKESRFVCGVFGGILESVYDFKLSVSEVHYVSDREILSVIYKVSKTS